MTEKFSLEDLFIKIIPGGVLMGILYLMYGNQIDIELVKGLDFFYTFLFFTFSFLAGELIQIIARELEWIIYLFFKFYKPSEIFIYKNNPVLKNKHIRDKLITHLSLDTNDQTYFSKEYKDLPLFWWKREKQDKSQSLFWKLYTKVSSDNEMKIFNRNFLFVRAITFVFLFISILFYIEENIKFSLISASLFILFLWRARGMARTLVFKTVLLNLKTTINEINNI